MRLLWILLMLAGVVVLGGLGVLGLYGMVENGFRARSPIGPILLLLGAGACGAGIFMSPREFRAATKPDEPEVRPAAWIEEMRQRSDD